MAPMQKAFWAEVILLLLVAALLTLAYLTRSALWLAILLVTLAGSLAITVALVEANYKTRRDERDEQINQRSWNKGYYVFWISFVLICSSAGFLSEDGAIVVPRLVLYCGPFVGGWILVMARAVSGLVLYKHGSASRTTCQ